MSVVSVNQMWSSDGFDVSTEKGLRKKATITEAYQIVTTADTTKVEIAANTDLPATGSLYPGLAAIRLNTRSFKQVSPIFWIGTMSYEGEFGPNGPGESPTKSRPVVSWSDVESDEAIDEDVDGNPIVTVNGEAIEGVTVKIADMVLNVEKNYSFFSPAATSAYRHSVNSDTFAGYPPGTGRLVRFSAKQVWDEDDNGYWTVNASIQFRYPYRTTPAKAWYARVLHQGYMVRESAGADPTRAWDLSTKEASSKPVLLKSDGTRETDPANAHWLEFRRYQALPYTSLGLLT